MKGRSNAGCQMSGVVLLPEVNGFCWNFKGADHCKCFCIHVGIDGSRSGSTSELSKTLSAVTVELSQVLCNHCDAKLLNQSLHVHKANCSAHLIPLASDADAPISK